jgi:hypothetical protein
MSGRQALASKVREQSKDDLNKDDHTAIMPQQCAVPSSRIHPIEFLRTTGLISPDNGCIGCDQQRPNRHWPWPACDRIAAATALREEFQTQHFTAS